VLVGEAKVPAVMYAQAVEGIEAGREEVEDLYVN